MNVHFLSGLPRSGSTLLAAILQQNRLMRTSIISPMNLLVNAVLRATASNQETSVFMTEPARKRLLKGLFSDFYGLNDQLTVLDSNRGWTSKMPLLVQLFPDCRMICCVRDPAWIMDSFEKLLRKHPLGLNGLFAYEAGLTVFDRADQLASNEGTIGFALNSLKDAYYGPFSKHLLLVEYGALTARPKMTVDAIYDWLSIPRYTHDFEQLRQVPGAAEFDAKLGAPGLHTVGPRVQQDIRPSTLPPELFAKFAPPFWHEPNGWSKVILEN